MLTGEIWTETELRFSPEVSLDDYGIIYRQSIIFISNNTESNFIRN